MYLPKLNINIQAKSQAGNTSQIYNDNTKTPKPKENQQGILGISSREFTHFAGNSASGSADSAAAIFQNTPKKLPHLSPKSCHNLVVGRVV